MHARHLVRILALLMTVACVVSPAFAARTKPNIVFIFTDDQRFDAIGAVDPAVKTPNLDRLAARGTRYANAFVTLSICSPSRAAVMTGQYGSVTGVTTLGRRIADTSPLLPKLLQASGYRTGMFGKWHLGNKPAEIGFDEANYFHSNGTFYGRKAIVDGKAVTVPGYIDDAVADWSVAFIERAHADRQPFFLWHCTQVPHMDHTFDWPARQAYLDMYDPHDPQRVAFTELYDLQSDRNEMRNLADEPAHADRVARMAERIAEHDRAICQRQSVTEEATP